MKKFLIALLLSLSCSLTLAAVGCDSEESSSVDSSASSSVESEADSSVVGGDSVSTGDSNVDTDSDVDSDEDEPVGDTYKITFTEGAGYFFDHEIPNPDKVAKGSVVSFKVRRSVFYQGTPIVYLNGTAITPVEDNVYSLFVDTDMTLTVDGVRKASSQMAGTGSMTDAFVVSEPIDLLFIAEQVNKGVSTYVNGAYVLGNDIDCGGEELEIIGDYSTENSYFSGCFSCIADSETGAIQRYTISNFTINSDSANYVGLFGTVFANPTVSSSGLFYGIRLDNFTVNVSVNGLPTDARSIVAGSLMGYGSGVNAYLCDATNGTINVYADDNYFAYAGGLIGYQQGFYDTSYGMFFPSEIAYVSVDVDVNVLSGLTLFAGGITGYAGSNYPIAATAFVHNSYSTGSITGALRAGGIVGGLGQYTSVSNCYAIGDVIAKASQSVTDAFATTDEYCIAYAGGLVGYAENDTIVSDSLYNGKVSAYAASGNDYRFANPAVGGGQEAGALAATAQKYIEYNCISDITDADLVNVDFFTENLGWETYDWNFESKKYPTICYEPVSTEESAVFGISFVCKDGTEITVSDQTSIETMFFNTTSESSNAYVPIGNFFYNGGLEFYFEADNGYLSYGYFFDEACTQKVPYSFVATRSIQLYVGFADPTPVIGTYQFAIEGNTNPITLTLTETGHAIYSDGVTEQTTNYLFDGETLTIEAARLARYYNGAIIVDEDDTTTGTLVDANFDMYRYTFYDFNGKLVDGKLHLYDGIYFTEENPLVAGENFFNGEYYRVIGDTTLYYHFYGDTAVLEGYGSAASSERRTYEIQSYTDTQVILREESGLLITVNLADLKQYDAFQGTWTKSATLSKSYTFDGINKWQYEQKEYVRNYYGYEESVVVRQNGTYVKLDDNTIFFTYNGMEHYATIDRNGFLSITVADHIVQTYYKEYSYTGTWSGNGITLELFGLNQDGTGTALATYTDGSAYDLVYEVSETNGYVCLYWPDATYWKEQIFGYFTYDYASNTLSAVVYDSNNMETGYSQVSLFVLDDYNGEWICNDPEFENIEFRFDGNGLYGFLYGSGGGSLILENGNDIARVEYTLDSTLTGRFAYNGKLYTITYNEDLHSVTISNDRDIELERKDIFADTTLVDVNGNSYTFDGKGNLNKGGKLVVNGTTTYTYKAYGDGFEIYNVNGICGSISFGTSSYILNLNNRISDLYIENEFMGTWAMSGMFQTFSIGPTDLEGNIHAVFDGRNITMKYIAAGMLSFRYTDSQGMPITYYVYTLNDPYKNQPTLVFSQYTSLIEGDYVICTKTNALFGKWVRNSSSMYEESIYFDGITSGYANGISKLSLNGRYDTYFYYDIKDTGIIMWSQDLLNGKTWYYEIVVVDLESHPEALNDPDAYICGDRALYRREVDGLYLTEAKSEDGTKNYLFNGHGKILCNGVEVYSYVIKSYNTNNTATLHVTDLATGVTYVATLNYANTTNIYLTLDDFYLTSVRGTDGKTYSFNGAKEILIGETAIYTYVVQSYNDDNTVTLLLTNIQTEETCTATLNYQNANDIFLSFAPANA